MLEEGLLEKLLKLAMSSGGDYADVFVEWRKPMFLQLDNRRIDKVLSGTEQGVGIRVIFGEKTAYAYSNDLSAAALLEMASTLKGAVSGSAGRDISIDLRVLEPTVILPVNKYPHDVPMQSKVELIRRAETAARDVSGSVRQVVVIYKDSVQRVRIANSLGALVDDERVHTVGIVQVVAGRDSVVQTGYEPVGGHQGFEIFDGAALESAAVNAAQRAVRLLSACRAPGGRMPVVISSEAGGTMIHEAIGHGLEADLSGQGLSKYSGMMGKQVASTLVSVIDDATLPGRRGSYRFDDEGTPAERTVLVKDGILVGYMYDRLSAMREPGAVSTGNGRRESYQSRPIPRMSNTFLAPGGSVPEDILRATRSGLYVRRMGGGQVNTVTGDFVFDVQEGYRIENGRLGELVRGATLTGNGSDVLGSIDMVGSDLGFSIGTCGKDAQGVPVSDALPTIRIPEMVVGGEVV